MDGIFQEGIAYLLPLVVVVSLVYSATRYETMEFILQNSLRVGVWILGFMAIVFAVLMVFMIGL